MTPGRRQEIRAIKRHLRDLLLHRANLLGAVAQLDRVERPPMPRGAVAEAVQRARVKRKAPH